MGTVVLLRLAGHQFKPRDPKPMTEMFATFKKIRKLRQKPAHSVEEDKFDQTYVKSQRDLPPTAPARRRPLRNARLRELRARSVCFSARIDPNIAETDAPCVHGPRRRTPAR